MAEVDLAAEVRSEQGSSNSRRLRNAGKIPGVMYGHGTTPTSVAVEARALRLALTTEAGVNALLQLNIDGTKHLALARDIQRHPVRGTVAHVDFQVVNRNEQVSAEIPITFIGEALKVTKNGGIVEHQLNSLLVIATPTTLPSHIEVDLTDLELDGAIRVKDLPLPEGVTTPLDGEDPVVIGATTRGAAADAEGAEGEAAVAEGATPTPAAES
jgi:large subunit ribosomal protein L25